MKRSMQWLTLGPLIFFLCLVPLGCILPFEIVFALFFGWANYLWDVVPRVTVSGPGALTAVTCLVLLSLGLHAFLRWFHGHLSARNSGAWQPRWTASLLGLFLLMFLGCTGSRVRDPYGIDGRECAWRRLLSRPNFLYYVRPCEWACPTEKTQSPRSTRPPAERCRNLGESMAGGAVSSMDGPLARARTFNKKTHPRAVVSLKDNSGPA